MDKEPISVREFFVKHRERITLLGVAAAFFVFIGGGIYLQAHRKRDPVPLPVAQPVSVDLNAAGPSAGGQNTTEPGTAKTTYFLKPSPEELLQQLETMENFNDSIVDQKFAQMPVLWPVYFFSLQDTADGLKSIVLDVSENGFGIVIKSEVDPNLYPQLQSLTRGDKIWIGGKIEAIDQAGTGTIYLKTEQLRDSPEALFAAPLQGSDK